ncbi:MAG: cupin domain-containing protein [Acidobacteria bacterium]|nr:cupin domain-containing protein [Acidobacteriota bacterium]MCB9399704.1 cupin domain-containing protein [Acidobacteriota bacterium]
MSAAQLNSTFLRLKPNACMEPLPVDETFWARLGSGQLGDFHNEYLVSSFAYSDDWNQWEMHPNGDELVVLLSGSIEFIMEIDGLPKSTLLNEPCAFVRVPQGTWHTAKVAEPSHLLFITAGEGTQHRPANHGR